MSNSARAPFVLGSVYLVMIGLLTGCSGSSGKAPQTAQTADVQMLGVLPPSKAKSSGAANANANANVNAKASGANVISVRPNQVISAPRGLGVMTVNLQHRDNPEQLATVAGHLKSEPGGAPDFILCQEVLFQRDGLHDSTADVLASHLGYHVRGTKRTSDSEGTAILSRYPIEYYESINLKSQTSRFLLGFRRVSTIAETKVPGVGLVRLVNVHFTNWGFEKRVRTRQLKETLEWAAQREKRVPAAITFLAGDFNADPDTSEMRLVKDAKVTGPLAFRDWNGSTPSKGPMGDPDRRIDYIFVSARSNVSFKSEALMWKDGVPSKSGRFYLSDHLALVHRYDYNVPAPAAPTRDRPTVITGIETETGR
jgi:endonuclease/exonuclease/phosphatase family metal-dependent hydrolase